jgi:hypothetical protein
LLAQLSARHSEEDCRQQAPRQDEGADKHPGAPGQVTFHVPSSAAELVINQLEVGFYHASVPNTTKPDTTLAFAFFARVHGCAFNECGLGLSRFFDCGCVACFLLA